MPKLYLYSKINFAQELINIKGGVKAKKECPNCHSRRNWKDGLRETNFGSIQRYVCRDCSHRFSDNSYKLSLINGNRQLCAVKKAKKLDITRYKNLLCQQ